MSLATMSLSLSLRPAPRTPSSANPERTCSPSDTPDPPLPLSRVCPRPGCPAHLKLPALQSTKWAGTALFPGLMDACLNTGAVCIATAHCMLNTVL